MKRNQKKRSQVMKLAVASSLSLALLHGPIAPGVSAETSSVTEVDTAVSSSTTGGSGQATPPDPAGASQGPRPDPSEVKFTKEQAEKRVRDLFPELQDAQLRGIELGNPNSYPQSSELIWTLDWHVTQGNSSHGFSIQVDALNGDIRSYYRSSSFEDEYAHGYPPAVNRQAAEEIAKAFAVKAAPSLKDVQLRDFPRTYPSSSLSSLFALANYSFEFQLVVDGVPSEVENLSVIVDGNGEIRQFFFNRYQGEYPSASAEVSEEEALAWIREQIKLEPAYISTNRNSYAYWNNREAGAWTIGYVPVIGSRSLQADDGEPLDMPTVGGGVPQPLPESDEVFTPHQGAQLTVEQARARVAQVYTIPEEYVQQQGHLNPDSRANGKQVWQLNWMKAPGPGFMERISAAVEADTGKIINFSNDSRMYYGYQEPEEPSITEAEARTEALRLIHLLYPDAGSELKFSPPAESRESLNRGQFSYHFPRYYGEYLLHSAGVYLTLDGNGELISYYDYGLSNKELADKLEPLELEIALEEAEATYLEALSTELVYTGIPGEIVQGLQQQSDVQLAYVPLLNGQRTEGYVDGITGKLKLDWFGTEPSETGEATDIEGHWAQEQLETMLAAGVLSSDEEGLLRPNGEISLGDWMLMITKALYGEQAAYMGYYRDDETLFADVPEDSPYVDAVRLFVQQKWLKADAAAELNPEQPLTRQQLAVMLTHMLNYDKLSNFMQQDVAVNSLNDAGAIQNKGAVAIVASLGLLQPAAGRFNPDGVVTKAQAATIIMRLVELQGRTDNFLFR
ncbi:YcdB/YcdC domain-containing protein [Paenibacillus sp. 1P07SE]|uniref:YcdB/YcdC domain-containing protein n=1 Tax=Paenibacillus sp. 1P07SE TaxID=3132209 RepID=UPI0039A54889